MNRLIPWCVVALLGLLGFQVSAQTRATAEITRSSAYVGDEVIYQVVVRGQRPSSAPVVAFPETVRAIDAGTSESSFRSTRLIDGQRTTVTETSITYQFRLTVLQPGMVEIPPAVVTLPSREEIRTEAVRFEALLPQLASGFELWVELDRRRLYVGETVTARVVWMIPESGVANLDFGTSVIDPSLDVNPSTPSAGGRQLNEIRFLGRRAFGLAENVFDASGRTRIRFSFEVQITPTRAGMRDIGPVRVVFDREGARGGRVRSYSESNPITLEVRPLPTEDRPAGFTGLIGRYELRTLASPTTVQVGDPITLRAELRGREPMAGADTMTDLASLPGFERFRVSSEGWREEQPREPGQRRFAATVRALGPDVTEIPPVRVWAFDPELERYVEVRSEPVQLDVRAVRETTLADAIVAPGGGSAGSAAAAPRARIGPGDAAFWATPSAEAITAGRAFRADRWVRHPVVMGVLASGPAAVLATGLLVAVRRHRNTPERIMDRRLRDAEHLVLRAGRVDAVRSAGAAVLGCEPEAVTELDLERLPVSEPVIRALQESVRCAERPTAHEASGTTDDAAREALRRLRREVRRGGFRATGRAER